MNKVADEGLLQRSRSNRLSLALVGSVLLTVPGPLTSAQADGLSKRYAGIDQNKPVLCLLPGRVRKLGGMMTYLERRKPAQLTASECEIRGGEYTLYDRANYQTALEVWREEASQGSAEAHLYVGEIYERGWLGEPDYAEAASWYAKAVEIGSEQAERRLAFFYEHGLGVEEDKTRALDLWRDALGLEEDLVLASDLEAERSESQRRIDQLLLQFEEQNRRTGQLQRTLEESEQALREQSRSLHQQKSNITELTRMLETAKRGAVDPGQLRILQSELAQSRTEIDNRQLAIDLLEAELIAQRAQVMSSERQAEVRERQLQQAQEELFAASQRGDALLVQLSESDDAINRMESELVSAAQRIEAERDHVARLSAELAAGPRGERDEQSELMAQLQAARQAVSDAETRYSRLQSGALREKAVYEEQLASADLQASQLRDALATSQTEKALLARRLGDMETRMAALDAQLKQSRHALADREVSLQMLQEQLATTAVESGDATVALRESIAGQERTLADLREERDLLLGSLKALELERNSLRVELASEVDTRTWFSVELESAAKKLARTREELRLAELALDDASFTRKSLQQNIARLEEDLSITQQRSEADVRALREELREARVELADLDTSSTALRKTTGRLESDANYYASLQSNRALTMRGGEPVAAIPVSRRATSKSGYHAVIIANYEYDYLPDLASPPVDAKRLKQVLEDLYGFRVTVLINLNRSEMYAALAELRSYDEDDHVLLYYAGHGRMDEYGEGYWLPVDYRTTQPLVESISAQDLSQSLARSPARHVLLVADSCYSGALARDGDPVIRKSVPALLKFWLANRSRTVLTSGGLKPVLDEGPGNNSVFASALLQTLEANDGALNGEMLHAHVYSRVRTEAANLGYLDQKPQFSAIEDAGHENGQFVFFGSG